MNPLPPECSHWADCDVTHGGCCTLGLHGGKPSLGICNACEHNAARGQWKPDGEPVQVHVPTEAERAAARERRDVITRRLWDTLHRRPFAADLSTPASREAERQWLAIEFRRQIPCGDCGQHWDAWTAANPPDLSGAADYFAWTVTAHNGVNKLRNMPEWTVENASKFYDVPAQPYPIACTTARIRS